MCRCRLLEMRGSDEDQVVDRIYLSITCCQSGRCSPQIVPALAKYPTKLQLGSKSAKQSHLQWKLKGKTLRLWNGPLKNGSPSEAAAARSIACASAMKGLEGSIVKVVRYIHTSSGICNESNWAKRCETITTL